jgi:hypothetical protein
VNGWIDWNGDGVWTPAEQVIDLALTGYSAINYNGTMTGYAQVQVPPVHVEQPQMRVNLGWSFDPNDPCTPSWDWGDVKDITLDPRAYDVTRLTAVNGNTVREILDRIIWEQSFTPTCTLTPVKVDYDTYPFSAPRRTSVTIRAQVTSCPTGGGAPTISCAWSIPAANSASAQQGTAGPVTAFTLDVPLTAPDRVGIYSASLTFTVTSPSGQQFTRTISRKLFVTYDTPLAAAPVSGQPKRAWYEKACDWGSVASIDNSAVLFVRQGEYAYGGTHWRYGYNFTLGTTKCTWSQLVEDSACNYSDCYVFSDVLRNLSGVLGVGGFTANNPTGSHGIGFVTVNGAPSIDPAFPGSARPAAGGAYDRYVFSSHSLLLRGGRYHDATFNHDYGVPTAFISWNLSGGGATDEGATITPLPGSSYDGWGDYSYAPPPLPPPGGIASGAAPSSTRIVLPASATLHFTGLAAFSLVDDDADGIMDALAADVGYTTSVPARFVVSGTLRGGTQTISIRPRVDSENFGDVYYAGASGTHTAHLEFSGEDIFAHGLNGPFRLYLTGSDSTGVQDTLTVSTPSYSFTQFGELPIAITSSADQGVDIDADGLFDSLRVSVTVAARHAGTFALVGGLFADTTSIATASRTVSAATGTQTITLAFPGKAIRAGGVNGPYSCALTFTDTLGQAVAQRVHTTQSYAATNFELSFLSPTGTHGDYGADENGNGLYDVLRAYFDATVAGGGTYTITGFLATGSGGNAAVFTSARSTVSLYAGTQRLTLDFPGSDIRAHGVAGPYTLVSVEVEDGAHTLVDQVTLNYATGSYLPGQFEQGPPILTYQNALPDAAVDTDANGLADYLQVPLQVTSSANAVLLAAADLYDPAGHYIVTGVAPATAATAGMPVSVPVRFDGPYVFGSLWNGAFLVKNAYIYSSADVTRGITIPSVGTTASYSYQAFEPSAVVTGHVQNASGGPAAGAELRSSEAVAYTDSLGVYRLVFLSADEAPIRVTYAGVAVWEIYLNGVSQGMGDSTSVDVVVGQVDTLDFRTPGITGVGGTTPFVPRGLVLSTGRPNPFGGATTMQYAIPADGDVLLRVYTIGGRALRTLVRRHLSAGAYMATWDGRDDEGREVAAGVYVCRIDVAGGSMSQKIILRR